MYSDKKIEKFFKKAKLMCKISDYPRNKVGAVIVHKGKVVSVGFNQQKSNPLQKEYNLCRIYDNRFYDVDKCENNIHAETSAILSAQKLNIDLSECSIFVYRQKKSGCQGLSKPCKACQQLLKDNGIKDWYYTLDDGWRYERKEIGT